LGVARKHVATAKRLNPGEPVIDIVAADLSAGRKPSPAQIDRLLLERIGLTVSQNGARVHSLPLRR
jgi:hypothetical protein